MTTWIWGDDLQMFGYDIIMADPAWSFKTWSDRGKIKKSPEGHYRTMSIEEIKAMRVGDLAAKNCLLWLWATHPMIDQQIDVLRAWGFRFVTSGVWVKRTKHGKLGFGTGYRLRSASEPFLIGINGNPETAPTVRTVIEGPLRRHSEKPDEAYQACEQLLPGARRADLFSRTTRPGWISWGDQRGLFDPIDRVSA